MSPIRSKPRLFYMPRVEEPSQMELDKVPSGELAEGKQGGFPAKKLWLSVRKKTKKVWGSSHE